MTTHFATAAISKNKGWIDRAKGICIILVVMMHTALGVEKVLGQTGILHAVVAWTKPFRMPDFFLLSGYLAGSIGALSWRTFVDRRVVHYVYFYLLWLAILTTLKLVAEGVFTIDSFSRAFAFGLIEPFGTLWFIYVLPCFMVVARFARGWRAWALAFIAGSVHIWAAAYPRGGAYAMSSQVTGWATADSIALFLVFFLGGYLGRPWINRLPTLVRQAPGTSVVALLSWAFVHSYALHDGLTAIPGLTIVFGFSGALAVLILAILIERIPIFDWFAYCGRYSLVIYLAFVVPMAASRSLIVGEFGVAQPDMVMIAVLVTAIGAPLLLERLVRNNWLRFIFSRPSWARMQQDEVRS